ncbi:Fc.00g113570.m01.CDS01 [Cosmosporella sp. VM-42]
MANIWRRVLGLYPAQEVALLGELISELKTASEAALGRKIERVSVMAPWQKPWWLHSDHDSAILDAFTYAGLKTWAYDNKERMYLGEISTAFAGNEEQLCLLKDCELQDPSYDTEAVFFVTLAGFITISRTYTPILQDIVSNIPKTRLNEGPTREEKELAVGIEDVRLIISEEPAFAAARGAALW